jgi:hypothetical protein
MRRCICSGLSQSGSRRNGAAIQYVLGLDDGDTTRENASKFATK